MNKYQRGRHNYRKRQRQRQTRQRETERERERTWKSLELVTLQAPVLYPLKQGVGIAHFIRLGWANGRGEESTPGVSNNDPCRSTCEDQVCPQLTKTLTGLLHILCVLSRV